MDLSKTILLKSGWQIIVIVELADVCGSILSLSSSSESNISISTSSLTSLQLGKVSGPNVGTPLQLSEDWHGVAVVTVI